jgi:hypothetical protein
VLNKNSLLMVKNNKSKVKRGKDMKKLLATGLLFCLLIFVTGCLDVTDAPIPPECPLFSGELKAAVGHSYAQIVKPNNDLFMKPINFNIVDDSKVLMYTYNDFAKANPALQSTFESSKAVLNLDYDLEKAFVLVFTMHVTTKDKIDHFGTLYFIVGSIQNDDVDGTARIEKFKIQGIGGCFDGFFTYQTPRDNTAVIAPWLSISGDGKIKYDRKTGAPKFMSLKGTVNGVIPGQVIFEFPFQTKLCDC